MSLKGIFETSAKTPSQYDDATRTSSDPLHNVLLQDDTDDKSKQVRSTFTFTSFGDLLQSNKQKLFPLLVCCCGKHVIFCCECMHQY